MALRINTNIASLNAHKNMIKNDNALSSSLEKLSSGLRINRAADDASGMAAMRLLLDERKLQPGIDFEAVVTGSDNAAFGALVELQARGVRVPEEAVVTGFDAQERSAYLSPPLTSVRQPIYAQGRQATELVLSNVRHALQRARMALSKPLQENDLRHYCSKAACFSLQIDLPSSQHESFGHQAMEPLPATRGIA